MSNEEIGKLLLEDISSSEEDFENAKKKKEPQRKLQVIDALPQPPRHAHLRGISESTISNLNEAKKQPSNSGWLNESKKAPSNSGWLRKGSGASTTKGKFFHTIHFYALSFNCHFLHIFVTFPQFFPLSV